MVRTLLVTGSLALLGCRDPESDCASAPSFGSADLPVSSGGEDPTQELWIEIASDENVTLNGKALGSPEELFAGAVAMRQQNPYLRAWISADASVTYAALMVVIDMLKQAGISRMAFGPMEGPNAFTQ
jgi:biopolymer transport protein ExbD